MRKQEWIPVGDETEDMRAERKEPYFSTAKGRQISAFFMIVLIAFLLFCNMTRSAGSVTCEMDDAVLGISCLDEQALFIPYRDMEEVRLVSSLESGEVIRNKDWDEGWCGEYRNELYGRYTFYAYSEVENYIVVKHMAGTLVFNLKSEKATTDTYEQLMVYCMGR